MPDELVNKLHKYFGFNDFLKGQREVIHLLANKKSTAALTKFLCGISSPMFMKRKIKQLPEYGRLEDYPYREVEAWVEKES